MTQAFVPLQLLRLFAHSAGMQRCCLHLQWQAGRSFSAHSASDNGAAAVSDVDGPQLQMDISQAVQTDAGRILDTRLQDEMQASYLSVSTFNTPKIQSSSNGNYPPYLWNSHS